MREAIRQGDIPGVQLRRRQALPLPPGEVWAWLSEPDRLARWLADRVEGQVGEGERLTLHVGTTGDGERRGGEQRGEAAGEPRIEQIRFVSWEPPHRWVAAFERMGEGWTSATRLVVEVLPRPSGTEISVLQDGFHNLSLSRGMTVWEDYRRRWRSALDRLAVVASAP